MAIIKLAYNAVTAKLIDAPKEVEQTVSDLLSYYVDGKDQLFSVRNGTWDGRSTFYEYSNQTFPAGFVFMVHAELKSRGYTVHLIAKPHVTPFGPDDPIVDPFGNDNPDYEYQMRALRQVEKYGRGIIQVATGGGKSKIAKLIISRYKRMSLFLTTRGVLLYQMKDQLDEIGLNTGIIGDGEMKVVRGINLGMVQTLVQALDPPSLESERLEVIKKINLSKKLNSQMSQAEILVLANERFEKKAKKRNGIIRFLELVEVVIGEEAHEAGGQSYYDILKYCKNASVRVALTATPFMKDSAEDNMRLMAAFGPKLIVITEKQLIDVGILAKPYFKFVDTKAPPALRKTSPWERAYKLGYMDNPFMHAEIVKDALMARDYGLPVLALIVRKDHGNTLLAAYKTAGLKAVFIQGDSDMNVRREQLRKLEAREIDVLIGTTIMDVGVDCPAIGLLQLCGGYKAEVSLRQRIGRTLRRKRGVANIAFVADYSCDINSSLRDHTRQRRNIIQVTPGFAEGILAPGEDFNWSAFKKVSV